MSKVTVYNQNGTKTEQTLELNPKLFGLSEVRGEVVHEVVRSVQAGRRKITAATKTRGEVRGGGKKPWRQKGTGRARAGSIRSPLWKGGGVTFGPRTNRNFSKKVNKQTRRLGILSVLTDRANENRITVIEGLKISGKSKDFLTVFGQLQEMNKDLVGKTLVILPEKDESVWRAVHNLPMIKATAANNLDIVDLVWADNFLISKDALAVLEKTYIK